MLKKQSLIFAPLEGITEASFREFLFENYPEWDYHFTDFYRLARHSNKSLKTWEVHIGRNILKNEKWRDQTAVQILTTSQDAIEGACEDLQSLKVKWIDLNAGCPMRRVVAHKGGAYLLSNLTELTTIIKRLRKNFPHFLSVKIRPGLKDDTQFEEIIKILEAEGVNAVTIHGRLQIQFYEGKSNWDYIKKAVTLAKIPIIGNGDINAIEHFKLRLDQTQCHSLMVGRFAMSNPWLAKEIRENKYLNLIELKSEIEHYLFNLIKKLKENSFTEEQAVRRIKALTPQMFSSFSNGSEVRSQILRSEKEEQIKNALSILKTSAADE